MNNQNAKTLFYSLYIITLKINFAENNIRQEFRLGKIDETRNLKHICLVSKKHKNIYKVLNYIEQLLILVSTIIR